MKTITRSFVLSLPLFTSLAMANEGYLVRDGRPTAEIVIATDVSRTTRLAAVELQADLAKISGATLPIVTKPAATGSFKVYVGPSEYTRRLGIDTDQLKFGAYRIVTGPDWMVLIGDDTEFTPISPWPRSNNDWVGGRVHKEWDAITGAQWGNPMAQLRKHYTGRAWDVGKPIGRRLDKSDTLHVWGFDERGSFNAVCGFLRRLGMRWYLPGELGEVVPSMRSIPILAIDETVHPDFPVRRFNFRFGVHGWDTALWAMRLGVRDPYGLQIAHGMHTMTHRDTILSQHPDWFALYGGHRDNLPGQRVHQLCYSNAELFEETLRYVRKLFDHYHFDTVSVMPPDGYVSICQCPLCQGKDTPERDSRGRLSDYVWDFVTRVANEIHKTHPDKMISCCAYGTYTLPPLKIDRLPSNVQVCIVGGRRPTKNHAEQQEEIRQLRESWLKKTDRPIMVFENYPFTDRGWYLPAFVPHTIGAGINATKDVSRGEDIWLSIGKDFEHKAIGFNHFLVYFTARMYWGGKQQDVDTLFREYCRLFYGPAESAMREFFEYCETHWQEMEHDKAIVDRALTLFDTARARVEPDTVFGKRVALIADFLKALRSKSQQLGKQRGPVPQLRLAKDATGIAIDGQFDDRFWQECPVHAVGRMRELQTGRPPTFPTTFRAAWGTDGSLYLAIHCTDRPNEPPAIGTARNDDPAIWYGDAVEVLLETDSHSYYQIAVSPSGAVVDLDRGVAKSAWFTWNSQADVATSTDGDGWNIEMRLPVTQGDTDPLHQVIGRKPTSSLPWYFNICRQRVREHGAEYSAFSPTGMSGFHSTIHFAQLYEGKSHQFDHAPPEADYLEIRRAAAALITQGQRAEALDVLTNLPESLTEFQVSDALKMAASCARMLKQYDRVDELASRIPLNFVAATVRIQNLLDQRKPHDVVDQFGDEDLMQWPFWQAGEACFLRGRAFCDVGDAQRAENDLRHALDLTTDTRVRADIWLTLGRNREVNRKNLPLALSAYQEIVNMTRNRGSATFYRGVENAASILSRQGRHDEAIRTLHTVDLQKLHGYWRASMHRVLGDILQASGRSNEAVAAYTEVAKEPAASQADKETAQEALKTLGISTDRVRGNE